MKRIKKRWIALLLGALLMATLVGVAGARPMRQTTYKLTIPAGHFNPVRDGFDWNNAGNSLYVNSGSGTFYAALPIALPGRFTVEKMTLFALDFSSTLNICAYLYRVNPWTTLKEMMAWVCTIGDSTSMQVQSTTSIGPPDTIYGGHGGYIEVWIPSTTNLYVHAVQIEYH